MTARTFDWRPSTHFEANLRWRVAGLDCYASSSHRPAIRRAMPADLDQGSEGACTGFGLAHVLAASPRARDVSYDLAMRLYRQAQREDEWDGEDYDGSSVNGAMHAGRTYGLLTQWRWCYTGAELRHALSYHGAVEAGTYWLSGMLDPDSDGYVTARGSIVGGHAYAVTGYRPAVRGAAVDYRIDNSWGPGWGDQGGAWITDVDLEHLVFNRGGEAACPVKVGQA